MSKDFSEWKDDLEESEAGLNLPIKNGLRYVICLTNTRKPKLKKIKTPTFKARKYIIESVKLKSIKVVDQNEIDKIIEETPNQEIQYDRIYELQRGHYNLALSKTQYEDLVEFLDRHNIKVNQYFSFRRIGERLSTRILFDIYKESTQKKTKDYTTN